MHIDVLAVTAVDRQLELGARERAQLLDELQLLSEFGGSVRISNQLFDRLPMSEDLEFTANRPRVIAETATGNTASNDQQRKNQQRASVQR